MAARGVSVSTKLSDSEREELHAAAAAGGVSVSDFVRVAVLAAIREGSGVAGAIRNLAEEVRTLAGTFDAAVRLSLESPEGATVADWEKRLRKLDKA